ncbi:hypothetical protein COLO4_08135 [Corchorus olitorius]|uniref:Uncharacterized protein n=1 Tax=Corchorus olitorius TaxID=93759 RepID=A0A1R3KH53_9ROSI|nr:hypothetical protein COLO4_08135 [Corchorus olitorius]
MISFISFSNPKASDSVGDDDAELALDKKGSYI